VIATGRVVSPVGEYVAASRLRRDIAFVPLTDGPVLQYAPVWRSAGETPLVLAFARAAEDARNGSDPKPG
jgi:hypothetical protein